MSRRKKPCREFCWHGDGDCRCWDAGFEAGYETGKANMVESLANMFHDRGRPDVKNDIFGFAEGQAPLYPNWYWG